MGISRLYMTQEEDKGLRLDALLARQDCYPSRSAAVKAIEEGRVLLEGQQATKNQIVDVRQAIVYECEDEKSPTRLRGEPIELDIRFEDSDILVISKQAGLICHPTEDYPDSTLVHALIYHCGADNLCNTQGQFDRLGIVHRLDRDTSGLMLAAKNDRAGEELMRAIRERRVDRRYLALVHGRIAVNTGMIDAPIARHPKNRLRRAVRDCEGARRAVTTFRVKERFEASGHDNGYTLIECKLFSGRTHQIRVHMEYTTHPLVGDPLYSSGQPNHHQANLGLDRQFLHSIKLGFDHPTTQEPLYFEDSLPADLSQVLATLRQERQSEVVDEPDATSDHFEIL